jgi:hypothetical protein
MMFMDDVGSPPKLSMMIMDDVSSVQRKFFNIPKYG